MKTRALGKEELVEFHPDITTFVRKSRKCVSRSPTREAGDKRISSNKSYADANTAFKTLQTSTEGVTPVRKETNSSLNLSSDSTHWNKAAENGDNVRVGTFDEPGVQRENTGIVAPLVTDDSFEIKPSLINSIQGSKDSGTKDENPLDHLDHFDKLCSMYKASGVSLDSMKMMLFPFSLTERAMVKEKEIPSNLVETWENVKKKFLTKFFPKQKTAKSGFLSQISSRNTVKLFIKPTTVCGATLEIAPHHGFTREALLGIFYKGCLEKYRIKLDSASGGSFYEKTVLQGEILIDKLVKNGRSSDDEDVARKKKEHEILEKN